MGQGKWLGAAGALNSQNAVLPEDYRVVIDTKVYQKAYEVGTYYICDKCKSEIPIADIRWVKLLNSGLERTHYKEDYSEHWKCPASGCGHMNRKSKSDKITERKQEPFYLNCVWEMPRAMSGLSTRFGYKNRFEEWFYQYQKELEHQIGAYRAEYQAQNPDDEMDEWEDEALG